MSTTTAPPASTPIAEASKALLGGTPTDSLATASSAAPAPAKRGKARKRRKAEETARAVRALHWPQIKEEQLWLLNGERGGFAQVPRTLSLFSELIIKQAVKKKTGVSSAAGTTYNVLWMHTQGQGISKIENETDAALEAGYGGERGVTTFRKHMRVLKDLGFVDYIEESRGRVRWVLMLNPYIVLKELFAQGLVEKKDYAAMLERASAIGSADELDDEDDEHAAD
jgi:hypothetical protein